MKNFNLIEWLQTDSHGKQSMTRDHHGTKSRELAGNPRPLRYLCATLALPLRYVAMIFAVLVLSMANIGMAWGATEDIDVKTKGNTSATAYTGSSLTSMSSISFTATGGSASIAAASGSYTQFTTGTTTGVRITFTPKSGVTVNALEFTLSSGNDKGSFTYGSTNATITNSKKTHTLSGLSLSSAFDIYCHLVSGNSSQSIKVTNVKVTYTTGTPRTFKSGEKIYFKDQESNFDFDALWKVSSGNVYAYFWNDTENAWSSYGDLADGSWNAANAIYEITVPGTGKEYTHMLFTRGNSNTCFDCSSTWDKTEDQTPAVGKNLFYVYKTKYADHIYKGAWGNFTPADKTVYFDNRNVSTWTTAYVRIGHGTNNSAWGTMTKVAGTKYLYSQTTSKYASHTDFAIANKAGWTGGNHIDQPEKTYSDGSWSGSEYKMTMQTNYQQYAIDSDTYICPKATSVLEHECQYYQVTNANSTTSSRIDANTIGLRLPSYTVTSSGTKCTVTMVKYTKDDFSTSSSLASGGTVMPTQYIGVTVSPSTGYKFSSVSLTSGKYEQHTAAAAGVTGKYAILGNCAVSATCVAKTCTVSFDNNGGTGGTNTVTATYDADMPSKASNLPTRTGYTFDGYWDSETDNDGTGTQYYKADGTSKKKWDKNTESATTLYAKWNINSHTLTWSWNGGSTSATAGEDYTAGGTKTYGTAITYPANNTMSKDYCTFSGWSTDATTMPDNDLTITAQWTGNQYSVTHTLTGVTTSSGATGSNAATYGTNYSATFAASSGYELPSSVTVTAGGSDITASCTYTKATGTVVIPGASITGNIVITVTGTYAANFKMVADASAASDATLDLNEYISQGSKNCTTLTGGTAQYQGASGKSMKVNASNGSGTSQYYGWYFNSSGDKIVVTMTSHILQVGSIISVEGYGASGNGITANTSTTLVNGTGSQQQWSASHTVVAGDTHLVGKNVITFDRYNSCRIFSITISNCQSGTMCVIPVLPSLTTPNQGCTTGDFAEWDASVTNTAAISAASGSQAVSYSWMNSSSVEVATTAAYTPTAAGTYTVTATVHSDASGYIDATATSSTLTASLYGNPSVTGPSDAEYEVDESASNLSVTATPTHGESLTYQWYSNTSKSTSSPTPTALENCTTSTYKPSTAAAATTYYFCKVSGGCEDVYSSIATVTVTEAPCFKFTCESQSSSVSSISAGSSITTASWESGKATLSGGTMTNSAASQTLNVNKTYGLVFDSNNNEVTVTLSGDNVLAKDAVITLNCYSLNDDSKSYGFKINGNDMSPATYTPTADSYETFTQSYTIPTASALIGTKSFKITRYNSNKVYLNGITVTGCDECEGITPSLSYSKTTLWVNDGDTSTPTLDTDESTGSVTYSSSNTDVATVNESTGVVTAVAGGNVTITASIAADGTHCANTATCNLTIKQATCGEVVIAGVTLTAKNAGTPEGTLIASSSGYVVSTQKWEEPKGGCGTGGKLGDSGNYICLTLKSGESFKNGDKVILDIATVPDVGDGKLHIYAGTSSAVTQLGVNASPVCGENEIILSGISSSTPSITLYRTDGDDKQNPYVVFMKVKRFICTDCLGFVDATENGNWNTAGNWIGSTGVSASVPTISDRVHIYKPVTVDINNAKASNVYIYTNSSNTGKVTIDAGNALIIAGKLAKSTNGTSYTTTAAADVIINSTRAAGTGALIIGGETGSNQATVNFETKVKRETGTGNWINQYIGSPFSDNQPYVDYALQLYKFCPRAKGDRMWWETVKEGDVMTPFWGYNVLYNDNNYLDVTWTGTLNATTTKTINGENLYYSGYETDNILANSWLGPIHVGEIEDSDISGISKTFYLFNAGTPQQDDNSSISNTNTTAGTYVSMPIYSAPYAGIGVIPAMQGFYVVATGASPSLTLDYEKVVYTPALTAVGIQPNRAPKRTKAENNPEVIKLYVKGETGWAADTYVLGREDFSEDYEDGWDGAYIEGESATPKLYSLSAGGDMFINCLPEIEGTVVAFRKGNGDSQYTFSFEYAGEEDYYLKDLKLDIETPIDDEHSYAFTAEAGDNAARFIIVRKTPTITTGTAGIESEISGARKVIYNNKVYIVRGGSIYSVDGQLVR